MTKEEIAELIDKMPQGMDVNDYIHELVNRALAVERTWVGLESDEQILEISKDVWGRDKLNRGRDDHRSFYIAFARAIEAKLKENA